MTLVHQKYGSNTIGLIFPILSRNRFAMCLKGIAKGADKIVLMLSYPSDEVGNHLIDEDVMDEKGVDPYKDVLSLERYRELFGYTTHPFTGVDYVDYYSNLIRECGAEVEVIFANDPRAILSYTKNVLNCDIHTRARTKRRLLAAGAEKVFCLDEIMTASVIIAIAGMEGALASVIGGLADCPVIAVPTSIGYGASFQGLSALLSMLNSCSSGVSVVNIDNGFGAGYLASMINHMEAKS